MIAFDPSEFIETRHFLFKHLTIKKRNRVQRRRLRASGHVTLIGQMIEIGFNFLLAHGAWMSFLMKQNKLSYPGDIRFFSFGAVVFPAAGDSDLIQELWFVGLVVITP